MNNHESALEGAFVVSCEQSIEFSIIGTWVQVMSYVDRITKYRIDIPVTRTMVVHPLFIIGFLLLTILGVVHTLASMHFWYWQYPWSDTLVHFLAGFVIGCFSLWFILKLFGSTHSLWRGGALYMTLLIVLGIGVCWEVFEYGIGVSRGANYQFDTALDTLMNVLGSLAAYITARKFIV